MSRQKIYDEAEQLVKFGLFDMTRKKRRKYIPAKPEYLLTLAKQKTSEVQASFSSLELLIPFLNRVNTSKESRFVVKYYEGMNRIKKAYEDELEACRNTEVLSIAGSIDDVFIS